ncbi:2-dehydropantoate 2-reductase [Fontibacillus solani]|uniref:2-dehydropantoate 2-reductase n=1 Tax=Fontibacillus solani TaxID=1572857 RepID=A0A7W3XQX7_9BACL|nr:ketopantoate reductase family protein [Fontibacillus solani]MBA9084861.1 2-dehydropantoate 2-reductase [Fontibacillus solani]
MRILVLGAGGVGGYFGGRLVEKGEDVTFLVRSKRKEQLEKEGLVIQSVNGDLKLQPKLITAEDANVEGPFDLILFSTKAYHLHSAIQDLQPFVGDDTTILPLLNGVAHFPLLKSEFGADQVIGGLCFIETTLNQEGHIVHTSKADFVKFGEFQNKDTERIQRIEAVLSGTVASFIRSDFIERDIWHKYLYIAAIAGVTTLMRAPMGPIRESKQGRKFIHQLFQEIEAIMIEHGAPLELDIVDKHMATMDSTSYDMKSSMLRDMEKGLSIEGEHLHGYLLQLAQNYNIVAPLLQAVYQNELVYELSNH